MLAWMLPTNEHSFYEIAVAAEPYMPRPYRLAHGLADIAQVLDTASNMLACIVYFRAMSIIRDFCE